MSIKVDNLENLFWDNGSWRVPNTFPKLATGKFFKKTPVMTSPVTGWVILQGDWNYCEYNDELYFLKKDTLISKKRNKHRYILIKDHFCNILKNKGNVFVEGTLVNASLDRLNGEDFNFTHPVINNFGKRFLYKLREKNYDWKAHLHPILPTLEFKKRNVIDSDTFSLIIRRLQNVADEHPNYNPADPKNDALTIFARIPEARTLVHDWRNEVLEKIKHLLSNLNDPDVILGQINTQSGAFQRTDLAGKWCITYKSNSIASSGEREEFKQVIKLDLSGLTDIRPVTITGKHTEVSFIPAVNKFVYDETAVSDEDAQQYEIRVLEKKVSLPFYNANTTRAIYHTGQSYKALRSSFQDVIKNFYAPQKILIRNTNPLVLKDSHKVSWVTPVRTNEEFRSVYLYYCENFNFFFKFTSPLKVPQSAPYDDAPYLVSDDAPSKSPVDLYQGMELVTEYGSWYPLWQKLKEAKQNFTFGWKIGQFSRLISKQQKNLFNSYYPYLVRQGFQGLNRITGLNPEVQKLIQNVDFFERQPKSESYDEGRIWTLDWFDLYPKRFVQNTKELDFCIGEKLLAFTYGPLAFTYFQPANQDYAYGGYYLSQLAPTFKKNTTEYEKGRDWINLYDLWNMNGFWRNWLKKAYDNYKEYEFKRTPKHFFVDDIKPYLEFEELHIMRNTTAFFRTEYFPFKKYVKKGDYFWTDLDYYWTSRDEKDNFTRFDTSFLTLEQSTERDYENNEIVVYSDVGTGKLVIGKFNKIPLEVTLPDGQFIATNPDQSESNQNKIKYTAYHLYNASTRAVGFSTFSSLIDELKANAHLYYSDWFAFGVNDVDIPYLFKLVGTDFYAYLDSSKKVHLIFDKDSYIKDSGELVYSIDIEDGIETFLPLQVVNQKCVLSLYGMKINLPVKIFEDKANVTITLDKAQVSDSIMDSASVKVRHSLGTSYFRFDIPKPIPRKTAANYDPFQAEALQSSIKRSYEDYRLQKEAQDLQFQALDNQFDDQKWEISQLRKENLWNSVLTGIGQVTSATVGLSASGLVGRFASNIAGFFTGGEEPRAPQKVVFNRPVRYPSFGRDVVKNAVTGRFMSMKTAMSGSQPVFTSPYEEIFGVLEQDTQQAESIGGMYRFGDFRLFNRNVGDGHLFVSGLGQGISQIGSTIASYEFNTQRFDRQEEQLARDVQLNTQQKLLQSYQLDLSFDRLRAGAALELRRLFSFQTFTSSSSYERNEQLDKQELDGLKYPVYLEVWTASPEQLTYLDSFHNKFGVDCRIPRHTLYLRDHMSVGLFKFEDPSLINLNDLIDNELLKARFAQGLRIEIWDEAEVRPDLIPVDPRILKLQNLLQQEHHQQRILEQQAKAREERLSQLTNELTIVTQKRDGLEHDLTECQKEVRDVKVSLASAEADAKAKSNLYEGAKKQIISLNSEVASAGTRYHDLSESYRAKEKELEETEKVKNLYLDEKNKLAQEKSALETDLKDTKARERVLIQEKSASNSKIENLEKEKTQLEEKVKECAKTEEQVSQLEEKLQKKEDEVNAQKLQIDSLLVKEQELNKLKEEIKTLVQGCGSIEEVKEAYAQTQKTFKELAREHRQLSKDVPKLVELQNKVKEQENTIKALREIEKFDVSNLPNKYALSAANNLIRAYVDYAEMKTYLFSSNEKSVRMPRLYQWDSKLKIFTLLDEYLGDIEAKKLWAYKNDGSSFSSATEFDMGYFWKFKYQKVRGNKFKKIWDGGIRITNPRSNLAYTDAYDDSYDKAIYVGETKLICSPYLDFVPKLTISYSIIESVPFTPEPHEVELERKIYFHPEKGWANDGNKVQNFKDLDLSKVITLVTYEDYLNFFGWKWDPVEKKAVPK